MYKCVLLLTSCLIGLGLNDVFAGLTEDIEGIKEYAKTHPQLSLAIGVNDEEKSFNIKIDQNWACLDDTNTKNIEKRHLNMNFNNLDELKQLAEELPGVFSKIVLDDNVYKFTNWNMQHIEYLKTTLRSEGTFQFPPDYSTGSDDEILDQDQDQLMEKLRSKLDETKLENSSIVPDQFPIKEGEYKDEIEEEVEKRKKCSERVKDYAVNMDLMQFQLKCRELGIKSEDIAPHHILRNPAGLERYFSRTESLIAKEINKKHFFQKFFEEVLLPHTEMVLKKVFREVELKRNSVYPIPSSLGSPRIIDFFVCTK